LNDLRIVAADRRRRLQDSPKGNPHRLVTVGRHEQVAVIGSHDAVLDTGGGELSDGPRNVVDYSVHNLSRLERESCFAGVVNLL
jgi:hypothetical protein